MYFSDRSEVYKVHVCQTDTWQIHIYFVILCLPKRRLTLEMSIHYVPRNPRGKIRPHKSEVVITWDIGYLRSMRVKLTRGRCPIRGIEGLVPFKRYPTLEVQTTNRLLMKHGGLMYMCIPCHFRACLLEGV